MTEYYYVEDQADIPQFIRDLLTKSPARVVTPLNVDELREVVEKAVEEGVPLVPRGAATSAYGGIIPIKEGVVVNLSKINKIGEVKGRCIWVEAGATWSNVYEKISPTFDVLAYPTSWFSTIGGWVATGGYGIHSMKFGHFSEQVEAIDVIDSYGMRTVRRRDPEFKYYFGTEGQFGIIVRIKLRIRKSVASTVHLIHGNLEAFERLSSVKVSHVVYYDENRLREINELSKKEILSLSDSILVEVEEDDEFVGVFENEEERWKANYLWNERFFPLRSKKMGPGILASELVMPIERLKDFVRKIEKTAHRFGVSISIEAHAVGNGRCLVIPSFTTNKRGLTYLAHLFLVLTLTQIGTEYGGVPYGTGIWNLPFVHERFSNLAELMSYKKEVDPQEIFNPMKTFQGPTLLPSNPRLRKIILSTLSKFVFVPSKKESDKGCKDALAESINACAKCSACVSVCPAYYITGDETITPRGKLYKARNIEQLSRDEAERMFFCLHCGRCEEVCQEGLRLLESWDLLEDILRERFDFPREKVEEFVAEIDRKDVYKIIRSW